MKTPEKGFMSLCPSSEGIAIKLHDSCPVRRNFIANPGVILLLDGAAAKDSLISPKEFSPNTPVNGVSVFGV